MQHPLLLTLQRTVRFCINPQPAHTTQPAGRPAPPDTGESILAGTNGFAGKPAMAGLGRYYELDLTARGTPDPHTGYLINIKDLDAAARLAFIPAVIHACHTRPTTDPAALLLERFEPLARAVAASPHATLIAARFRLTPTFSVERTADMPAHAVVIRQRFDFAAAHRLHAPHLTDQQNRDTFGKCNNPAGHGHNYQLEPAVRVAVGAEGIPSLSLAALEQLVERHLIDPFDHTHLNLDTPDFNLATGLNPSVENIAAVFYQRLAPAVRNAGAELLTMTVWETDRTSCTYPAS